MKSFVYLCKHRLHGVFSEMLDLWSFAYYGHIAYCEELLLSFLLHSDNVDTDLVDSLKLNVCIF